jgi:uncharacterized membrane protein YgcG
MPRLLLPAVAALALVLVAQATPAAHFNPVASGVPTNLRAFLLRADEPIAHSYPRTPSFSWHPTSQPGGHYQFEIATAKDFQDGSIVFKNVNVQLPAVTVPRQLPWMTGSPYALWAQVRWISSNGMSATQWSTPFGFNMQWSAGEVPAQLPAPEGLVRWAPIDGATGYEVLYPDLVPAVSFQTTTNVADEREFFTFHNAGGYATIHWRVRAIRDVGQFKSSTNGLPAVSYGPWSAVFTTVNAAQTDGTLKPTDTISDTWNKAGTAGSPHELTPGFAWAPSAPVISEGIDPGSSLYRVYIFTDKNCVNRVFTGSIVGSPAWAPRTIGGPMPLPADETTLTAAETAPPYLTGGGSEGTAVDATGTPVVSNETPGSQVGGGATSSATSGAAVASGAATAAGVDLWDSGWPSGRYYWTVVPVSVELAKVAPASPSSSSSSGSGSSSSGSSGSSSTGSASSGSGSSGAGAAATAIAYHDMAVPQDSCQAGLGMSFGKVSQPVVTSAGKPFLSGVAATGREVTAADSKAEVFASPIAAWQPVVGASKYQVELSQSLYPWRPTKRVGTPATSVVLPITEYNVGVWYYRVRGYDDALPAGARAMSWSTPIRVQVTGNRVAIVGSSQAPPPSSPGPALLNGPALLKRVRHAYEAVPAVLATVHTA